MDGHAHLAAAREHVDRPVVVAAEELDLAVLGQATQVAGAIDATRRVVGQGEEVGDEFRGGEFVAVEIALGHADAGDADLAGFAAAQRRRTLGIEDDDGIGRQRRADGDRLVRAHAPERGGHGGFGRAVAVQQRAALAAPALDQRRRAGLAADQQHAKPRQIALDRGEQRRHAAEAGDALRFQKVRQFFAEQARGGFVRGERRARDQGNPELLDRKVEGDRHSLVHAVARPEAIEFGRHAHEIADRGMRDGDALGLAGRSRGIEDVAERTCGERLLAFAQRGRIERGHVGARRVDDQRRNREGRKAVREPQMAQHQRGFGIGEDMPQPVRRVIRIQRHIHRARLEQREQRDIGVEAPVKQHRDPVAGLHAARNEKPRHLVRARVEVAIGNFRSGGGDGGAVGVPGAGLLQHRLQPLAIAPAQRRAIAENRELGCIARRPRGRRCQGQGHNVRAMAGVGVGSQGRIQHVSASRAQ